MQSKSAELSGAIRPRRRTDRVGLATGPLEPARGHKFTRGNDFNRLTVFRATRGGFPRFSRRSRASATNLIRFNHFVSYAETAKNRRNRKEYFAMRNETFRKAGRKSLKSL